MENCKIYLEKIKTEILYDITIRVLEICPRDVIKLIQKDS